MADAEVTTLGSLAAQGRLLVNDGYRTKKSELDAAGVPEPVKDFETRAGYVLCMSACREGSLIQALVGSFGGVGRRPLNRLGLAS